MNDKQEKKSVSSQKLAANRKNAQRSTGPQTPAGKQQSSQNSYKHGFYALRLFPNKELLAQDEADYNRVLAAYRSHYAPVGDLENLSVEKIAVESLRLARLLGHEQKILACRFPFETRSIDRIGRYESNVSRQLEKAIERLGRLQAVRLADANQFEPSDLESHDAISNPDEASEQTSEAREDPTPEEPLDIETSTTPPPHIENSVQQGVEHKDAEPSNEAAETASNPPPPQNYATKAREPWMAKAIEKAMSPTPAEEHKGTLGSGENYQTGAAERTPPH
jgi:hypothetical protein